MKLNIDLGKKPSEDMVPVNVSASKTYYPSFTYSGDESLNLPKEGTMVVKFTKRRESTDETEDGTRYTCEIEVNKIVSIDSDEVKAPAKSGRESSDALDALMAKKRAKAKSEDEEY